MEHYFEEKVGFLCSSKIPGSIGRQQEDFVKNQEYCTFPTSNSEGLSINGLQTVVNASKVRFLVFSSEIPKIYLTNGLWEL